MSWQIFIHSICQLFGNLGGALQVSGILTLAQVAIMLTIGRELLLDDRAREILIRNGTMPWGRFLVSAFLVSAFWLWIVVGWHRYILLNERPGLLPALRIDRMLGYFGKALLIGLILLPLALVLLLVAGLIAEPMLTSGKGPLTVMFVTWLIVYVPLVTFGLRLSTALPGVALDSGVPVFSGWDATQGVTLTILGVAVIVAVFSAGLEYIASALILNLSSFPGLLVSVIQQWIVGLLGVSILTTLYGHYVENRPLV